VPCPAGQLCLSEPSGTPGGRQNSCIDNPCAPMPVACGCAADAGVPQCNFGCFAYPDAGELWCGAP
jgi:hypothetical protein